MERSYKVGVIGGGAWGTALSIIANRAGSRVVLCSRNPNMLQSVEEKRVNELYLPNIFISPDIATSSDLSRACDADMVIIATPTHSVRSTCIAISDMVKAETPLIIASKGIERGSLLFMSEVCNAVLPANPVVILSGPNFADEAARNLPTATTLACADKSLWNMLTFALGGNYFRPYLTDDVVGAQVGGAIKNIVAIACGIAEGRGLGENARAALVTRGFAEMARLAVAKGARYETLMGLSGLGDLLLTCSSQKSRNMSFGVALGQGKNSKDVLEARGRLATEGVIAAESIVKLARKFDVEMPICEAVYRIIYKDSPIDDVIASLLDRPFITEGV